MKNVRTTAALLPVLLLGFACTGRTQAPLRNTAGEGVLLMDRFRSDLIRFGL